MTRRTVHINTVRKRKRAQIGADMVRQAKELADHGAVAGYVLIAYDEEGRADCRFDTGGLMPLWAFPGAAQVVVLDAIQSDEVAEDYRRPVSRTPWETSAPAPITTNPSAQRGKP